MEIHAFEDDPLIEQVLQAQQQISQAGNEAELMLAFATYFYRLSGCTHWLDLCVKDLAPGQFRVMDRVWFADPDLSAARVQQHYRWDDNTDDIPVQSSPAISAIIRGKGPKFAADVSDQDDPILAEMGTGISGVLAVPIYHDGTSTQWILLFRPMQVDFNSGQIRAGMANINLLSRTRARLKLLNQIKGLHREVQGQLEEVLVAQRSLLPQHLPEDPRLGIGVRYEPCDLAGGDYYDFNHFDRDKLGIVVADVSGHGAKAAVVMSMLRSLFAAHRRLGHMSNNVVDDINKVLVEITDASTFVTAFFLAVNFEKDSAFYANAGHPPALWFDRDGGLKSYPLEASPPLGILPDLPMLGAEIPVKPGDRLVLYTDGLTEATGEGGDALGTDRLARLASSVKHLNAQSACDAIMTSVLDFEAEGSHQDDKCVLVVDYRC